MKWRSQVPWSIAARFNRGGNLFDKSGDALVGDIATTVASLRVSTLRLVKPPDHGFFCNRGFWTPWLERLQGSGHAFTAINLEPLFGSIDDHAPQIDEAVRRITDATGVPPLLVCHSMGGLAARAWLKRMKAEACVHHVVTIGTPHRGTWLARFGHGLNGHQMRLLSEWHTALDYEMPAGRYALFTCWYSNCDNIVFPASNATLPGACNRLVRRAAHVQMAFVSEIMQATLALLDPALA